MRRLILGLLLGCFLTLIGAQAAHTHKASKSAEPCSVCLLAQQAARHVPKAAPAVVAVRSSHELAAAPLFVLASRLSADLRARAPPAAV